MVPLVDTSFLRCAMEKSTVVGIGRGQGLVIILRAWSGCVGEGVQLRLVLGACVSVLWWWCVSVFVAGLLAPLLICVWR